MAWSRVGVPAPPGPCAPRTCSSRRGHSLQTEGVVWPRGTRLVVAVRLLALDQEGARHDGQPLDECLDPQPEVTPSSERRQEPGGNAGQHRWRLKTAPRPRENTGQGGEREVRGRRGLAPRRRAHQVALGQVARVRASAATATAQW